MYTVIALICSLAGGECEITSQKPPVAFFTDAGECAQSAIVIDSYLEETSPDSMVIATCVNWNRSVE